MKMAKRPPQYRRPKYPFLAQMTSWVCLGKTSWTLTVARNVADALPNVPPILRAKN